LKDFSTPSLNSCESPTGTLDQDGDADGDDEGAREAEVVRLSLRRRWETRYGIILWTKKYSVPMLLDKALD